MWTSLAPRSMAAVSSMLTSRTAGGSPPRGSSVTTPASRAASEPARSSSPAAGIPAICRVAASRERPRRETSPSRGTDPLPSPAAPAP